MRNTDPAIMTFSFKQRDVKLLILHNIDNTSIFFFFCQENVFTHLTIMNYTIDKIISMYLFFSSCFFLNSSNFLSLSLAHSFARSLFLSLSLPFRIRNDWTLMTVAAVTVYQSNTPIDNEFSFSRQINPKFHSWQFFFKRRQEQRSNSINTHLFFFLFCIFNNKENISLVCTLLEIIIDGGECLTCLNIATQLSHHPSFSVCQWSEREWEG